MRRTLCRSGPPFTDLGSCPGGTAGQTCTSPTVGPADGRPELLIGATGVDDTAAGTPDIGRVYVLDGATRAILKRIDIPAADRTPLALTTGSTGFGERPARPRDRRDAPATPASEPVPPCRRRSRRATWTAAASRR